MEGMGTHALPPLRWGSMWDTRDVDPHEAFDY